MKVKLLVSRAGAMGAQNAGEEIEVSADEAARMIEAGQAIAARGEEPKPEPIIERAVFKPSREKRGA